MAIGRLALAVVVAVTLLAGAAKAQEVPAGSSNLERLTECRPGEPEPSTSPSLRSTSTARCPYDLDGLYQRVERVLTRPQGRNYSVTSAALTFGLPTLTSAYDSDRSASYRAEVTGEGGWAMRLSVEEAAYPLDGQPAAFVPGPRPQRLMELNKLSVRYDIDITLPEGVTSPDQCLTVAGAVTVLEANGWTDATALANLSVMDGNYASPTFKAAQGGTEIILQMPGLGRLATDADKAAHCLTGITVMQPPS